MEKNIIYNEDSLVNLKKRVAIKSVDQIVTDLPFALKHNGKAANYNRKARMVLANYVEVPEKEYPLFCYKFFREAKRVLKEDGSMYVFSGWTNLRDVLNAIAANKLYVVNHIIWKYQFGVVTKKKFVTSHYHLIYVTKKKDANPRFDRNCRFTEGKARYKDLEDVWNIKREYWHGKFKTPNKLPLELVRKILAYSSRKNDIILDPFMGSGSVLVAAKEMQRRYIGFELVKPFCNLAQRRLDKVKSGPQMHHKK